MIEIELETANKKYTGQGETMLESLNQIPLDWEHVKAKGVFTFTDGKNTGQKLFYLKQLKRLFANKTARLLWARNFEELMRANVKI